MKLFHTTNIEEVFKLSNFLILYSKYVNEKSQKSMLYTQITNETRVIGINKPINFQYFCLYIFQNRRLHISASVITRIA